MDMQPLRQRGAEICRNLTPQGGGARLAFDPDALDGLGQMIAEKGGRTGRFPP